MSGFRDRIAADNEQVFINLDEFADLRIVAYDGVIYDGDDHRGIPVVMSGVKEQERPKLQADHVEGLYLVTSVLHCKADSLGGILPEKGQKIKISEGEGGGFFRRFRVASSINELGMFRIELEAIDE